MGNLSMQQLSEVEAVQTVLEPEAVRSYGTEPRTDEVDQTANHLTPFRERVGETQEQPFPGCVRR